MLQPLPVLGDGDHHLVVAVVAVADAVADDERAVGQRDAGRARPPARPGARGGHGHDRGAGPGKWEPVPTTIYLASSASASCLHPERIDPVSMHRASLPSPPLAAHRAVASAGRGGGARP